MQVNAVPSPAFAALPSRSFLQNRPATGALAWVGAAVGIDLALGEAGAGVAVAVGVDLALGEAGAGAGAVVVVAVELGAANALGT